MNDKSRTYNTARNAIIDILSQFMILIINFATRKIFIVAFGENYLGIGGLFSNILSVLSLAELGVGSSILYCMYRPVAEGDNERISALMSYYKKLYRIIGLVVLAVGLIIVPFLGFFVNLDADIGNITLYYLLYLLNVVASYFLVYKTAILVADQKKYIVRLCTAVTQIVQFATLTVIALVFQDYTLYLALHIVFSVLANLAASIIASRKYPVINRKAELCIEEKKTIWQNIRAMFSYQIGNVVVNNTDNILISILVGTVMVGFYSNYSMVIASVSTFVMLIFAAAQASIGNLAATESDERQYDVFKKISIVSFCITSFATVCFVGLFQDFIEILFTDYYLLGFDIVLVASANFYIINILQPVYCYRTTVGLFRETKLVMIYTAIINIVLSVILGKFIGLFGILLATIISRLLTNFWYEPKKLYQSYFHKPVSGYFLMQLAYLALTAIMVGVVVLVSFLIGSMNVYLRFLIKIALCVLMPTLVYLLCFGRSELFLGVLRRIFKSKSKKL